MTQAGQTLGIIAGAGELPIAIAQSAQANGRPVFVLALNGMAEEADVQFFPHAFLSLGEIGKALQLLADHHCAEITFAGRVARPPFASLNLDARGAMALPRVLAEARKGDDALLRAVLAVFEKEGFRIAGSDEAARDLLAPAGLLGKLEPTEDEMRDIAQALKVVQAMGALDIGQAAVVCDGLVLAVEAAEGTDAMLSRVAALPANLHGTQAERRGVLLKAPKPAQDRRVDLPVVGVRTVEMAAAAGLSGIGVQAGAALLVDRRTVSEAADRLGIFVYGFTENP